MKTLVRHYDSARAMMDAASVPITESEKGSAIWHTIWNGTEHIGEADWYGVDDGRPDTVRNLAQRGWPEGVARLNHALAELPAITPPQSIRRRRVWSDQGDSLDMPRIWAGRSDVAWQRCKRSMQRAPAVVTLYCNMAASSMTTAEQMFWRGAAVLRLADYLTHAGYNVEVIAATAAAHVGIGENLRTLQTVQIKPARGPLELNTLAAVVCLSGFYRIYEWASRAHLVAKAGSRLASGVGRQANMTDFAPLPPNSFECPREVLTMEKARDWIKGILAILDKKG